MKIIFDKFFGLFDTSKLPSRLVALLDKNFQLVSDKSTFFHLVNRHFVDATSAPVSVYLTDGTQTEQDQYYVKIDGSANAVTIVPFGTQTIQGAASYALSAQYENVLLTYDSGVWYII